MLIETHHLERNYQQGDSKVIALRDCSISIHPGEFVAITGPSGCGKTTLLQVLGLLDREYQGEFRFEGWEVGSFGSSTLGKLRLSKIGFVFQHIHLIPALSVLDNVAWPHLHMQGSLKRARQRAQGLLKIFGLQHRLQHKPHQLSGGEAQRTALARSLVNNPTLILADEPTAHLDEFNCQLVMDWLARIHRQGKTVVVASHDLQVVKRAQRHIVLRYGQIAEVEPKY